MAQHQLPINRKQFFLFGQSNPELHYTGLPWVTCFHGACRQIWKSLAGFRAQAWEESELPALRVGKQWPSEDHWEEGRFSS